MVPLLRRPRLSARIALTDARNVRWWMVDRTDLGPDYGCSPTERSGEGVGGEGSVPVRDPAVGQPER